MTDFYSAAPAEQIERLTVLAHSALRQWDGRFGEPRLLKHRENAVFAVERADDLKVVLRVHRFAYHTDAELRSELTWMQSLRRAGVPVPQVVRTRTGRWFATASCDQIPEPRQVDMLTWLHGEPIGEIGPQGVRILAGDLENIYWHCGRVAAQLHNHSNSWRTPPGFARHSWDTEGLVGANPVWGRFWDLPALSSAQRILVNAARERAHRALQGLSRERSAFGLIHADFVPENLLYDGSDVRLIDFDDAGFGWYMFELATPLFFHFGSAAYAPAERALLAGYESIRPVALTDLALLPLFMLVRGFTYLGWMLTRRETEAAQTQTPMVIERTLKLCRAYVDTHS